MNKFGMEECSLVSTPMVTGCKLSKMDKYPVVDKTLYRSIIGSLLYLKTTRPNIKWIVVIVGIF